MQPREIEFIVGIETSTTPAAGTPTVSTDIITLGYLQGAYSRKPQVTGTRGAPTAIVAATGLPFAGILTDFFHTWFINGSGGPVDVTGSGSGNKRIADGTAVGQKLRLIGCDDTNTVTFQSGNNLILNATRILSDGSVLELEWDGADWNEVSWNNI